MSEKLAVGTEEFWRNRFYDCVARHESIHHTIYITGDDNWNTIQSTHSQLLAELLTPSVSSILDAGCGYGALYDVLPHAYRHKYLGIDLSPELIYLAQARHYDVPERFQIGNLEHLRLPWHSDFTICRSIDGMVRDNQGEEEWLKIARELFHNSKKILLLSYSKPSEYILLDTLRDKVEDTLLHGRTEV